MWLALLGLGGLIVVGTFVHAFLQWRARFGEERRVVRIGEPAEATVIDRVEVEVAFEGSSKVGRRPIYHGSLVLEVRREGHPAYRAPCKQWFGGAAWALVMRGEVVPVRVDRGDPQRVFVDTDAALRAREAAQEAARVRQLERQQELLRR
jgi:hypothetical protein